MNTFNKEFNTMMNEEKEISTTVRQRLDFVYDDIRKEKKTVTYPTKKPGGKWLISAATIILCILVFSNGKVQAALRGVFGLNQAAQYAEEQNFFNDVDEKSTDQGITLQLTKVFADTSHIGFQIDGKVDDMKLLKNIESIFFDYYIKDADGNYVIDMLGNEQLPLKSSNPYQIGSGTDTLADYSEQLGTFTQQIIIESSNGLIPNLDHSTIEIVSVSFTDNEGNLIKTLDGLWEMPFNPNSQNKDVSSTPYQITEIDGNIEDLTATADATGLRISFKCNQNSQTLELLHIKVRDHADSEYASTGFTLDDVAQTVNTILPYSAFQDVTELTLIISIGESGKTIGTAKLTKQS